jgi:hypothetical protein
MRKGCIVELRKSSIGLLGAMFAACSVVLLGVSATSDAALHRAHDVSPSLPKLAPSYTGTVTNVIEGGATTKLLLKKVKESKVSSSFGIVTGTLVVIGGGGIAAEQSNFTGSLKGETLTLTIPKWNNAEGCLSGGCIAAYVGNVGSNSALTGYFSYYHTNAGPGGIQGGTWKVKASG